jgi:hypothetical protein
MVLESTDLRKVNSKFIPSHASLTVHACSLIMEYISQYCMAKLQLPNHWSFKNFTLFPTNFPFVTQFGSPSCPQYPFLKGRWLSISTTENVRGIWAVFEFNYLFSQLGCWVIVLCTQDASRQRFKSLKCGIPIPPISFLWVRECQLARWYLCLSS